MNTLLVIPVRMQSSRFPGKPLKLICGMPMVRHCYERALLSKGVSFTYIATCDKDISDYATSINANVVMTSNKHERATDRTAEALRIIEDNLKIKFDVVIMLQGDEPMISPDAITKMIQSFKDKEVTIVNIISKFKNVSSFKDQNNVKVTFDRDMNAMYFSREPIPSNWKNNAEKFFYMQVGVIGFRREELIWFLNNKQTPLEQIESVDMNRVLENGKKIKLIINNSFTIGVDTEEELKEMEQMLKYDSITKNYINK